MIVVVLTGIHLNGGDGAWRIHIRLIFVDIILTDCDGLSLVVFNHHIVR